MRRIYLPILLIICILFSIDLLGDTNTQTDVKHSTLTLSIIAGINFKNGIIENKEVDSVTGASKIGAKAGVRTEFHIANNFHFIETGLEYSYIPQEIKYNDPSNGINGKRKFDLNLIRFPLTYNMHFFNDDKGNSRFVTRLGLSFSYLLSDNIKDKGTVPSYFMNKWETGVLIGFVYFPFVNTGLFFDTYRGFTQLYEDKYHTREGQGNLAGFTFGIQQLFPNLFGY